MRKISFFALPNGRIKLLSSPAQESEKVISIFLYLVRRAWWSRWVHVDFVWYAMQCSGRHVLDGEGVLVEGLRTPPAERRSQQVHLARHEAGLHVQIASGHHGY